MLEKLNENASLSELITTFGDVKNELQISKNNIASALGSPFAGTDKLDVTKTKIETLKNTFATNLTNKNVSTAGSESMQSLIDKVSSIKNIIKTAKSGNSLLRLQKAYIENYNYEQVWVWGAFTVDSLAFKPNLVFAQAGNSRNKYTIVSFDSSMELKSNLIFCTNSQSIPSTRYSIYHVKNREMDVDNGSSVGHFSGGFRLPIPNEDFDSSATISWFALGYK
ncbi:tail fiber protein H [Clostridioides difficile]|uniref:hypothetical protein n=1 Tax=Clostridioides difficile TaxID=1496 RepID=UPI00017F4CEC|nr:hypothetical protein [Clostridioides difficile]EGT4247986.1 hypothetical protein [Clostridioides difficile]MBY1459233.1 hypothetical protein [Clostridioides difficile]MBY1590325.1 hypothetical protein [Clostridioides difficile]MBY2006732.1 hypothetical protein [Clostridioides difficile]MBY2619131.1 hypothetical protein [Clostridioides difficile]